MPGLTSRQAGAAVVAAGLAVGVTVTALLDQVAVAVAIAGLLLGAIVLLIVDVRRRLQHQARMLHTLADGLDNLKRNTPEQLGTLSKAVVSAVQDGRLDMSGRIAKLAQMATSERDERRRDTRNLTNLGHQQTREVEALLQLFDKAKPRAPMPSSGGWALRPSGILQLTSLVEQHRPGLIVELGSGTSTVWLGYALEGIGQGTVVSLDHDPTFAARTRALVEAHRLSERAEIRDAALREVDLDGSLHDWYDPDCLADLKDIDMLVVDGPPKATGEHARYPALPMLRERLAAGAIIVLDDASRKGETDVARRWLDQTPDLIRLETIVGDIAIMKYRSR